MIRQGVKKMSLRNVDQNLIKYFLCGEWGGAGGGGGGGVQRRVKERQPLSLKLKKYGRFSKIWSG